MDMSRPNQEPNALPKELAELLRYRPMACIAQPTNQGTALVFKAPNRDIQGFRGRIHIGVGHQCSSDDGQNLRQAQ